MFKNSFVVLTLKFIWQQKRTKRKGKAQIECKQA